VNGNAADSKGAADVGEATSASSSTSVPRFVLARDFGERATEINDLYNRFTGKKRTLEAYRWEFYQSPAAPSFVWTITETASGQIVGHHGIVPTPLVRRGAVTPGGRTENTIIDHRVRRKIYYPGMERKALAETLQSLRVVYTVDATLPGPIRRRLGYKPVGRWTVYLPRIGPGYLHALLQKARARLGRPVPDALLAALAQTLGRAVALGARRRTDSVPFDVTELAGIAALADEYPDFWRQARERYDLTIDRSLEFLRWRYTENPHLAYRTWTLRRDGSLRAVVVGHAHALGDAESLYVDDLIVADYDDDAFAAVLACLPSLDPQASAIVVMTLAVDTPLHRALQRRFPLQAFLLRWFGERLFGEMLALDADEAAGGSPWYVTPIFTEGMDTSR
jgi:hypothetical protein